MANKIIKGKPPTSTRHKGKFKRLQPHEVDELPEHQPSRHRRPGCLKAPTS